MEDLIRITPNKEKARSMLKMADTTLSMVEQIDKNKFPSNVAKEYYDIIRELISIILLLDGYKTLGEGAHKRMIEYLEVNYSGFDASEISLIDDLRIIRNKIAYDGFFVKEDYVNRKLENILGVISKLKDVVGEKLR